MAQDISSSFTVSASNTSITAYKMGNVVIGRVLTGGSVSGNTAIGTTSYIPRFSVNGLVADFGEGRILGNLWISPAGVLGYYLDKTSSASGAEATFVYVCA